MINSKEDINRYLELLRERGAVYEDNEMLRLITDPDEILEYGEKTGRKIGIIYQSAFNIFLVDLVENGEGRRFFYERIVKTNPRNAVVVIPRYEDKFILLRQFRHAMGDFQTAFPRGYGEPDLTAEENAGKEISEELNAKVLSCKHLGKVIADSGVCGDAAHVYLCEISRPVITEGYEEIKDCLMLTYDELRAKIEEGLITDGFTLSAFALMMAMND